jgi:hypothetical protein
LSYFIKHQQGQKQKLLNGLKPIPIHGLVGKMQQKTYQVLKT